MTTPAAAHCNFYRDLALGGWYGYEHRDGGCRALPLHVVDDFGGLVPLEPHGSEARNTNFWFDDRCAVDESAAQWVAAQWVAAHEAQVQAEVQREKDQTRTRALLRPAPITVEIGRPDDFGDTPIRVGHDPRYVIGAPSYRLEIPGSDPVFITQAQLAALLVAGEALCKRKRAPQRRKASL